MKKLGLVVPVAAAAAALAFAAPASAASAKLVLTPSSHVKNHATIAIKGTGFAKKTTIYISECSAKKGTQATCDVSNLAVVTTSSKGTFSAKLKVHTGKVGSGKCLAKHTCYIGAAPITARNGASAGFTFA